VKILGISAYYHDSAAVLVVDGEIVSAAQEERFTRIKHDHEFPSHAVESCLQEAGLKASDLDYVAFYDKPLLKFDRLLETYLSYAPAGLRSFRMAMPQWLGKKLHLPREIRKNLSVYDGPIVFPEHHESHAASAFFPSPFESAAILTVDGVGEWATTTIGRGEGRSIRILKEHHFPHSLGLLYSAFTYYTGFRVNSGEYKLMGLAPYGTPRFREKILELLDLKEDGSFRLRMEYFQFCQGLTMTNARFDRHFGQPRRKPESELTSLHMDVAASIQSVTEEIMLKMALHARELTGERNLCLAGGVALNCVANGKLRASGIFDDIWVQPAAGDAGGALGAALFVWHQLLEQGRTPVLPDAQKGSLLGPSFTNMEIRNFLMGKKAPFEAFDSWSATCQRAASLLAEGKVVGVFQGRMEFGPRALGSRSILGDARLPDMQSVMNRKIKFRESFRPFAPAVLADHANDYFDIPQGAHSPYMLMVAPLREELRLPSEGADTDKGLLRVHALRSTIPAVTHVDYSARVQTVDEAHHPALAELLREFHRQTGCAVLVNTSFNVRGEPIVGTPSDAYRCFMATHMDALVLENNILLKTEQPDHPEHPADAYLSTLQPD